MIDSRAGRSGTMVINECLTMIFSLLLAVCPPHVQTMHCKTLSHWQETSGGRKTSLFLHVPYADSIVNKNRATSCRQQTFNLFSEPQPQLRSYWCARNLCLSSLRVSRIASKRTLGVRQLADDNLMQVHTVMMISQFHLLIDVHTFQNVVPATERNWTGWSVEGIRPHQ
jgi:hypothetical protein